MSSHSITDCVAVKLTTSFSYCISLTPAIVEKKLDFLAHDTYTCRPCCVICSDYAKLGCSPLLFIATDSPRSDISTAQLFPERILSQVGINSIQWVPLLRMVNPMIVLPLFTYPGSVMTWPEHICSRLSCSATTCLSAIWENMLINGYICCLLVFVFSWCFSSLALHIVFPSLGSHSWLWSLKYMMNVPVMVYYLCAFCIQPVVASILSHRQA